MGLSSSKTTQKTDQNTTQSGTTMPVAPEWLTEGAQDYVSRIGAFGDMDPNQFIAGPSPLQQQAWGNVDQLGGWRPQSATAAGMAMGAGMSGPNTAGKYGQQPSVFAPQQTSMGTPQGPIASKMQNLTGGVFQGQAAAAKADPMGAPQVAQGPVGKANPMEGPQVAQGPGAMFKGNPMAGPQIAQAPGLVSGQGYSAAPQIPGYAQPRTGHPIGYQPPPGVDPNPAITGASQAAAYENPYQQQVIDTSLAGFDRDAEMRQARMEAAAAGSGAFGGSRFGIAEGQFNADNALNRAGLDANLRSQGFQYANQMGMQDAGAGNNMLQFDAGQRDRAADRQLQAAGLLGQQASQYGADTRADLGMMSDLGGQQRAIEQAYAGAPLMQLEGMGGLMGATPYQILTGQQIDSTGTMKGTNVTTQTPSMFNQLLSLGALGASAFSGGMFK